jgi:hypothetical protein
MRVQRWMLMLEPPLPPALDNSLIYHQAVNTNDVGFMYDNH